jgi:hypothetical protein
VDGKPCLLKDGFHKFASKYDKRGNLTEWTYFGVDGRPVNARNGWARLCDDYSSSGQRVQRTVWKADPEGRLRLWERQDGQGRVLERMALTAAGRPQTFPSGAHRWIERHDERGNAIEGANFGLDGKPIMTTFGFQRWAARFNEQGKKVEQAHFGTRNEPAFRADDDTFRTLWPTMSEATGLRHCFSVPMADLETQSMDTPNSRQSPALASRLTRWHSAPMEKQCPWLLL